MKSFFLSLLTGQGLTLPLITFLLTGALIFFIAARLAQYADAIADVTGLGRLWIGSLLLAGSTSLPEILTDINAAAFALPDIGVGDLFGSTLANMFILALLIIVFERRQLLQHVALDHALVGSLAILLTALAGLFIAQGGMGGFYAVGYDTLLLVLLYLFGMRVVFDLTQRTANAPREETVTTTHTPQQTYRRALLKFGLTALGLLCVAPSLIFSAEAVAIEAGLSNSFVGTVLVGCTTSFPEMATAIAAVRLGAIDLAVGNLFGSNAFNMTVFLMMDLTYRNKPLFAAVSHDHIISADAAVIAIALGVMAILARTHRKPWVARSFAILIVAIYILNIFLLAHST